MTLIKRKFQIVVPVILLVILSILQVSAQRAFVHPGGNHNQQDLDFVKAQIDAGAQPWTNHFNQLLNIAVPTNNVIAPTSEGGQKSDGRQAYANALAWHYTGNTTYAENAIAILNMWGNTFNGYPSTAGQDLLQGGWIGALLGPAAELMRDYSGWSANDQATVRSMFINEFYPVLNTMSTWNGNVDLTQIDAMLNIAVYCEDETEFDLGIQRLNARNPNYFYVTSDGGLPSNAGEWYAPNTPWIDGLTQETCRDYGHHAQYAMASALHGAEVAWNQGVDIYGQNQERYTQTLELMALQMTSGDLQGACSAGNTTTASVFNTFEIGYNHYHNRMGLDLPQTANVLPVIQAGASDWNIFFETLTHHGASDAISACSKPDLGNDQSICGQASLTLNASVDMNGKTLSWYKDDVLISGEANNTIAITEMGTYRVEVDSIECSTFDEIEILGAFPIDLGEDIELCETTEAIVDAGDENGSSVTFLWSNGSETQSIEVNEPGIYSVTATVPNCGQVSDEIEVTSGLLQLENETICSEGDIELIINEPGNFEWYSEAEGGDLLETGSVFNPTITEDITFFVNDAGGVNESLGKPETNGGETWAVWGEDLGAQDKINRVTVSQPVTLRSLAVYVRAGGADVTINVNQGVNTVHSASLSGLTAGKQTIPLDFSLEPGVYTIDAVGTTGELSFEASGASFPYEVPDFISFTYNSSWQSDWYGMFYDWEIVAGNACARSPLTVIIDPNDVNCTITNVFESQMSEISIYPNPGNSAVRVQGLPGEHVEVMNGLGFPLFSSRCDDAGLCELNVSHLQIGVYIVRVGSQSEKLQIIK